MTTKIKDHEVIDKHGKRVRRDGILHDGDRLNMPISLMDSANSLLQAAIAEAQAVRRVEQFDASLAGHKPGFRAADVAVTATAEHLRDERNAKLENAWRNPPTVVDQPSAMPAATTQSHDALIAARDKRISEAWRS